MLPVLRRSLPHGGGLWLLAAVCVLAWTAAPLAAQEEPPACSDCHDVDTNVFEKTVHGSFACTDCHTGAAQPDHTAEMARADCSACHQDAIDALAASSHGKPAFTQISGKPACQTCHGPIHRLAPREMPGSPINAKRLPDTCGACHATAKIAQKTGLHLIQPIEAYRASVHARGIAQGKPAADCGSCHGSHDILPPADPASHVNRQKVPETCGTCHEDIAKAFAASIHGVAAARGIRDAPVCTDCHGEHRILSHLESGSPVYASNVPEMTCGRCHGDVRLSEKFGLPSDVVSSFKESFHGLAGRSGRATVANCSSCHGVHDILPSTDPRSHIHKANLAETCGSCHPGAGTRFAIGPVHVNAGEREHAAVYWIRRIYLWLIWAVIGGMVLHNVLDLRRKVLSPTIRPVVPVRERRIRMALGFRFAHAMMASSFIVLAYTGFALKYPEHWWATPIVAWEDSFGLRGGLHRFAAVVMLLSLAVHLVHLMIDRRARACIKAMAPNWHDVKELRERIAWFFGRRAGMPKVPPLGYVEKAEYLSLMWGTVVMAITGFLLWFENFTLRWLPTWVVDVSTAIHFYEAVLATLAILVWHFYSVMLDPLVYPMDMAWLHGREAPGRTLERIDAVVPEPERPRPAPKDGDLEPARS